MREGKQKRDSSDDDDDFVDWGKESRSSDDDVPDVVVSKGGVEEPPLVRSAVSC